MRYIICIFRIPDIWVSFESVIINRFGFGSDENLNPTTPFLFYKQE